MRKSHMISELAEALVVVQGQLEGAKMDAINPFFKHKYATLASVWAAGRQLLSDNGLSVVQTCSVGDSGSLIVDTTLLHTSGQWIGGELAIKPARDDPQGLGSAITYARRYGLAAIIGVCPEDDDAEAATDRPVKKAPAEPQKKDFNMTTIEGSLKYLENQNTTKWGHLVVAARLMEKYNVVGDTVAELVKGLSEEQNKEFAQIVADAVTKEKGE